METFRSIYQDLTTSSPTKFFTTSEALAVRQNPILLKEYVQTRSGHKKFINGFFTDSQSGFKILKRLTVLHHLILHNPNLAYIVQDISAQKYSSDKWFNQNILQPYYKFIKKFASSIYIYEKCKTMIAGCFKQDIYQILFYLINIFRDLFRTVHKLQPLGRYFRQKAPYTIDSFVYLITLNSQIFYLYMRSIIQELIQYPQKYLSDQKFQKILKEILTKDVPQINQQMKRLFLDKYFYPFSKGYGVKLFSVQDKMLEQNRASFIISSIVNETLNASNNLKYGSNDYISLSKQQEDQNFIMSFNKIDFSQTMVGNPQNQLQNQRKGQSLLKINKSKIKPPLMAKQKFYSQQQVEDV